MCRAISEGGRRCPGDGAMSAVQRDARNERRRAMRSARNRWTARVGADRPSLVEVLDTLGLPHTPESVGALTDKMDLDLRGRWEALTRDGRGDDFNRVAAALFDNADVDDRKRREALALLLGGADLSPNAQIVRCAEMWGASKHVDRPHGSAEWIKDNREELERFLNKTEFKLEKLQGLDSWEDIDVVDLHSQYALDGFVTRAADSGDPFNSDDAMKRVEKWDDVGVLEDTRMSFDTKEAWVSLFDDIDEKKLLHTAQVRKKLFSIVDPTHADSPALVHNVMTVASDTAQRNLVLFHARKPRDEHVMTRALGCFDTQDKLAHHIDRYGAESLRWMGRDDVPRQQRTEYVEHLHALTSRGIPTPVAHVVVLGGMESKTSLDADGIAETWTTAHETGLPDGLALSLLGLSDEQQRTVLDLMDLESLAR